MMARLTGALHWLEDNPVYQRERELSAGRSKLITWGLLLGALSVGYLGTFYALIFRSPASQALDAAYAPILAEWLAALVGVVFLNGAFKEDYENQNALFLVMTPLRRADIVLGKLLAYGTRLLYTLCALIPLAVLWSTMVEMGRGPVRPVVLYANFGGYFHGWGRPAYAALVCVQTVGAFFLAATIALVLSARFRGYWRVLVLSVALTAFAVVSLYPPVKGVSLIRMATLFLFLPAAILTWLTYRLDDLLCRDF